MLRDYLLDFEDIGNGRHHGMTFDMQQDDNQLHVTSVVENIERDHQRCKQLA